jgi:hypothetical protein
MGAGATAAAAILASGGSAGANAAALYVGYGVVPAVGGGVAADDVINDDLGLTYRPSRVDPNRIRFTQDEISPAGRIPGTGGYTVAGNMQSLQDDAEYDLPSIKVFHTRWYMKVWPEQSRTFDLRNGETVTYTGDTNNLEDDQIYTLNN